MLYDNNLIKISYLILIYYKGIKERIFNVLCSKKKTLIYLLLRLLLFFLETA